MRVSPALSALALTAALCAPLAGCGRDADEAASVPQGAAPGAVPPEPTPSGPTVMPPEETVPGEDPTAPQINPGPGDPPPTLPVESQASQPLPPR